MSLLQLQAYLNRLQIFLSSPENFHKLNQQNNKEIINKASAALQELDALILTDLPQRYLTIHDGEVHDPLGAGSYIFQTSLIPAVVRSALGSTQRSDPLSIIVHIGAQPNNSPHAGTLVVFFMGLIVASELARHRIRDNVKVRVQLDLVDTAPDSSKSPKTKGTQYQKSLRSTQALHRYESDYDQVLRLAANGVEYDITRQADLTSTRHIPAIIERIVKGRDALGPLLAPDKKVLAMRAACPNCGLAEKHGVDNTYTVHPSGSVTISFDCPHHGRHYINTSNPEEVTRLEFNTPLRNLVRSIAYALDSVDSRKEVREGKEGACERVHIRVTGLDYAGFYADQMLWRAWLMMGLEALSPPVVLYAPLIVDWAGSKISKSLYVKDNAYEYMKDRGMDYLLSFEEMKKKGKDPLVLFRLVESWVREPKKLFRCYSAEYLHMKFGEEEQKRQG